MTPPITQSELQCLRSVKQAADELRIPILLVGASARRLVFNLPNGIPLHRATYDWDFGVRVPNWSVFLKLRTTLLQQFDRFEQGRYEQRLTHITTGVIIDLVPFGELENDSHIYWPDSAFEMNVIGFSDAYDKAVQVQLSEDFSIAAATTPLLTTLKFFAFHDRGQEDDDDLMDLWHIIHNYVISGRESEFFDEPLLSVVGHDFDWEYAPALLLGFDISRACKSEILEKLLPILHRLQDPYSNDVYKLTPRTYSEADEKAERQKVSTHFQWVAKGLQIPR